jgi:hypothetical protein
MAVLLSNLAGERRLVRRALLSGAPWLACSSPSLPVPEVPVTLAMAKHSPQGQEEEQRQEQHMTARDQKQQGGD